MADHKKLNENSLVNKPEFSQEIILHSEVETRACAARLAAQCRGGEIILLEGPLGAGKTCFAGGFAAGLGIEGPSPSPTFVLLRSYASPRGLTLHHFDFYRLSGDDDAASVGLEDCLTPDAIVLIEWASRCPRAIEEFTLRLEFSPQPVENERLLQIKRGALAGNFNL